jgi:hypothetical protein
MKYTRSWVSRMMRYAFSTVVPLPSTERRRKPVASPACTRIAT